MMQLQALLPVFGAEGQHGVHGLWWIILAVVVFMLVAPLAYMMGRRGGRPGT